MSQCCVQNLFPPLGANNSTTQQFKKHKPTFDWHFVLIVNLYKNVHLAHLLSLSMHTMSEDGGAKDRAALIKLQESVCNTCGQRESGYKPFVPSNMLPLSRHVCISHWRKRTETIKPSLLGNGSYAFQRRLTPPPHRPVQLLWKHTLRGSAFASLRLSC